MNALASLLAVLAVAILRAVWARADLKDEVRLEIANHALGLAAMASEWKARAAARPDGGGALRVRDGAATIRLPGVDPDAPVPSADDARR